jgi:ABC-type spermidine/putrescine transport system permease subunit II
MAVFSFNDSQVQALPLKGFTSRWYSELAADAAMKDALLFSFEVSIVAVVISLIAGTGFGILFTRVKFPGIQIMQLFMVVPVILAGMVLGISLLLAFRLIGVGPGMMAIVIAHVIFLTPIVTFILIQRLRTLDPTLEQASMDLGAGRIRTFAHVTFPSIRVALLAAALLAFTVSFDEIAVTFFVSGFRQTLPVHIWALLRFGFSPAVNAVLTVIAVVSVAAVVISTLGLRRSGARQVV